jgi:NADPH:quinone reductase-like Zn-dependent oxidoreductase
MRAWLTAGDGIDRLREVELDDPAPGDHEVLLRVSAASLNYRDLLVIRGEGGWRPGNRVVPVSDAAGVVQAVGRGVTRFRPGDLALPTFLPKWVSGPLTPETYTHPVGGPVNRGMLADLVVVDEDEAVLAPRSLDPIQAATLPVAGVTAWHALTRTAVTARDVVLIHGTGGVALMALHVAHALGAEVIVTSGSEDKRARARLLGADHTIDHRSEDVAAEVRRITAGQGADVVIETVGGSNLDVSLDALRLGGRIAFIGLIAGLRAEVSTYKLVTTNATLHGIETGSRDMLEQLVAFIDAHRIIPHIDSVHPWAEVPAALRRLETGGHFGKVVVSRNADLPIRATR